MRTRYEQMTAGCIDGYNNFLGNDDDYKTWYGVAGQSRDSNCLERSNFRVALKMLGGEGENVRVERYGHWACGWVEEIYIRPETKEFTIAQKIENSLAVYPVLDDMDYSEEEMNEANEIWKNCYDAIDRLKYIREHKTSCEFNSFSDLLQAVRGNYFPGYPSDLID